MCWPRPTLTECIRYCNQPNPLLSLQKDGPSELLPIFEDINERPLGKGGERRDLGRNVGGCSPLGGRLEK